jgi:hypothetical protein
MNIYECEHTRKGDEDAQTANGVRVEAKKNLELGE